MDRRNCENSNWSFSCTVEWVFLVGITIQDSIFGNNILKIIGVICLFGFFKILPQNKNLF